MLAVLAVAVVHGTGARHVIPGLKSQTRSAAMMQLRRPPRARRLVAKALYDGRKSTLIRLLGALVPHVSPRAWLMPPRILRAQRAPGQDAASGVARRSRWLVLGGMGRLGPGAGI